MSQEQGHRGHAHGLHGHGATGRAGNKRSLALALVLNAVYTAVEAVAGFATGSLALLADAGHNLSDVLALGLALGAVWLAERPPTPRRSFGFKRAEILAALLNALSIIAIAALIFVEAARRFANPPEVPGGWLIVVAAFGVAINAAGAAAVFRRGGEDMNMRASFLHLAGDALGSLGVIAAGAIILATGWAYADPLFSVLIGVLILASVWGVLRDSLLVLLEAAPRGIDPEEIGRRIAAHPGVVDVHDLHVWTITSGFPALSAHVLVHPGDDCHAIRRKLEQLLDNRFGITHTTLQVDHSGGKQLLEIGDRPWSGLDERPRHAGGCGRLDDVAKGLARERRKMKRHRLLPLIALLGAVMLPSAAVAEQQQQITVPDWVQARLAQRKGEDVALIFGTLDHAVGDNRISFLVVRSNGSLVRSPQAKVLILREGATRGVQTTARLVSLEPEDAAGKHGHAEPDATTIYVVRVTLKQPGRYWMVAEPESTTVQGFQSIDVRKRPRSPSVGSKAVASKNPTLRDGPAATITTAKPPDFSLLRYSIAGSLAAHAPFVLVFATPKYCQSRTCGPAVETLEAAQKRFAGSGIRFIHVEVYQDNNPGRGLNKWMQEWHLPTEPWVFVVDRRGIIRDKFEGAISLPELVSSIRTHLR